MPYNTLSSNDLTMKVYAVIGEWHYEGVDFASLRLFDCKSTAEAYHKQLVEDDGYDYALLKIREVCMESAIRWENDILVAA
jgi:hypothetical protein